MLDGFETRRVAVGDAELLLRLGGGGPRGRSPAQGNAKMPKLKTKSSAKKRFSLTAKG